ncbi:MAG: hypothetical protein ING19_16320 [Azospirillum sp.]|nr:hypothetical protein [Azospirillum sp.]
MKTPDLLDFIERAIVPTSGWNTLGELNAIDWRASAQNGEARRLGEALVELLKRVDVLLPAERERLLAVLDGETAKKSFPRFLKDNRAGIVAVRRLEIRRRSALKTLELAEQEGIVRVTVFVPAGDAEKLKAFARGLMETRGLKIPSRPIGRPRKKE